MHHPENVEDVAAAIAWLFKNIEITNTSACYVAVVQQPDRFPVSARSPAPSEACRPDLLADYKIQPTLQSKNPVGF